MLVLKMNTHSHYSIACVGSKEDLFLSKRFYLALIPRLILSGIRNALFTPPPIARRSAKRIATTVLVLLAFWMGTSHEAQAETIHAASVERDHVASAIAAASDGDVVVIPAGTATYTTTIIIDKAITLQGAGPGRTIILDNVSGTTTSVFIWKTTAGKRYRMTGIEIGRSRTNNVVSGAIRLEGLSKEMRIDNCKFNGPTNEHIAVYGGVYGVIDNCHFVLLGSGRAVVFHNGGAFGGAYGDGSWENDVDWGGPGAMYVEDSIMEKPSGVMYSAFDGWIGGRVVIRHNTFINTRISNHGTESSQRLRSGRSMEIYNNTFSNTLSPGSGYIHIRGGSAVIFNNTISGPNAAAVTLTNYRAFFNFIPWGCSDGTKAWDSNDTSDGSDTYGGASDGVFEAGSATAGGTLSLTDATKNWSTNQWAGYVLRHTVRLTGASGSLRSVTVPSAGWTPNQWSGWEITKIATNEKASISSNSSDTLTIHNSTTAINFSGGGDFVLSRASEITSNSASTLTIMGQGTFVPNYTFNAGDQYEIRRVLLAMDQPGAGKTNPIQGSPPNHQRILPMNEPIYQWNNTVNGASAKTSSSYGTVKAGRDFHDGSPKPGYTPYTYPHPLRSGGDTLPPTPSTLPPSNARIFVN